MTPFSTLPIETSGNAGGVRAHPLADPETDEEIRSLQSVLCGLDPSDGMKPETETEEQRRLGYEEGLHKAKATIDLIMERYHQAIGQLELLRDRILVETETDITELALYIAREVLGADVEGRRDYTVRMTEYALRELREADAITLRLSPTDKTALHQKHPEFTSEHGVIHIVEDPSISLGGVIAECEFGRIDATLQRRLSDYGAQLLSSEKATDESTAEETSDEPEESVS